MGFQAEWENWGGGRGQGSLLELSGQDMIQSFSFYHKQITGQVSNTELYLFSWHIGACTHTHTLTYTHRLPVAFTHHHQLFSPLKLSCSVMSNSVRLYGLQPARPLCPWERILKWVVMPSSRRTSQLRDQTHLSMSLALVGGFFTTSATWEAQWCWW